MKSKRAEYLSEWVKDNPDKVTATRARYYAKHREKLRAIARAKYASNPEKSLAASATWRLNNPDAEPNKHLIRKFGITIEEYNLMFEAQDGKCAICKEKETTHSRGGSAPQRLAVDHDHTTNVIRGLLCFKCNTTLHYFENNKEAIINIENYLRSNS